jgi:hypothetical protein
MFEIEKERSEIIKGIVIMMKKMWRGNLCSIK